MEDVHDWKGDPHQVDNPALEDARKRSELNKILAEARSSTGAAGMEVLKTFHRSIAPRTGESDESDVLGKDSPDEDKVSTNVKKTAFERMLEKYGYAEAAEESMREKAKELEDMNNMAVKGRGRSEDLRSDKEDVSDMQRASDIMHSVSELMQHEKSLIDQAGRNLPKRGRPKGSRNRPKLLSAGSRRRKTKTSSW